MLALLAEIIGTLGGFGSSVFFVPLANQFYSFHDVLGITALLHVFSNLSKIVLFRKGLNKKLLIWLGIPAVVSVIIGGLLTSVFDDQVLTALLGIFLCSLSLFFLLFPKTKFKDSKRNAIGGGALSGFIAGILGTGGAIRGLTMAAFGLPKDIFIATSASIDMGVDLSRGVIYWSQGYIGSEAWTLLPWLIVISIVGSWLGKKLLTYVSEEKFRKISLGLILLIGALSILELILKQFY